MILQDNFSSPSDLHRDDLFIELSDGDRWYPGRTDNQITVQAIAHSLSTMCRFAGHCRFNQGTRRAYTVAEHSVKVSYLVPTLTALLHDAHEAVVVDLPKPIKTFLGDSYERLERSCEIQLAAQFGLEYPHGADIKTADTLMVLIESIDLLPSKGKDWGYFDEFYPQALELYVDRPALRPEGWPADVAYKKFLHRYYQLTGALL